ncbi:DUF1294 domain-containing protein [Caryophanon latum]|uniref:DUF1294 domain-containing protein n=1 Tax=Caryophanon latum TaxID=33977 RepID=A0A1C0Z110_9BACL|nr:DUF1294 domain-containing protein [Caryophanon latum]OCS93048.1 hypothetical protein A6K76_00745 [Caryophanon latum]
MFNGILIYTIIMSIVLCALMAYDKERAKNNEWRVSEKTLIIMALCGGALGGVLGMYLFRHKTKHNKFAFGLPLLGALHVFVLVQLASM